MPNRVKMDKRVSQMEPLLRNVVWAVSKGIGDDVREYLAEYHKTTNNAIILMRGDNINTNLENFVVTDSIELKKFNRSAWRGCILIDRQNKFTITICTRQTLETISRKRNRRIPHYLMSILYVLNGDLEAPTKQIHLADLFPDEFTQFSNDELRDDFEDIMEDEINYDDGYRHGVVVYESKNMEITDIEFLILDADLDTVHRYSLNEMVKPNFNDLTAEEAEPTAEKAKRNLVSLKAELSKDKEGQSEKKPLVSHKEQEVKKQA
ncbi:MAG: DUF5986 family protein [Clostridiales bacterium]|nr:DUF5986 family protein [Clostridiales bacterium]